MTYKEFERQNKIEQAKRKVTDGIHKAADFAAGVAKAAWDHRLEITAITLAATGVARTANKIANDSDERKRQRRMSYDGRTHEWYEAKHDLSSKEKMQIDDMYRSGMSKGEAMESMGILKK